MTLTEFLLARVADDEAFARDMGDHQWWEPTRYLAECEAKRRIVEAAEQFGAWEGSASEVALCALAAVYADHPDYDESWRP